MLMQRSFPLRYPHSCEADSIWAQASSTVLRLSGARTSAPFEGAQDRRDLEQMIGAFPPDPHAASASTRRSTGERRALTGRLQDEL